MKIFQKIILSYRILKIKKIWFKFLNISKSLREEESKKNIEIEMEQFEERAVTDLKELF